jgi:hypothetical protein
MRSEMWSYSSLGGKSCAPILDYPTRLVLSTLENCAYGLHCSARTQFELHTAISFDPLWFSYYTALSVAAFLMTGYF